MAYGIVVKRVRNNVTRMKSASTRSAEHMDSRNDTKQRASASQYYEKYTTLAREALAGGDRISAENYFQHAEHFFRVMNESRSYKPETFSPSTMKVAKEDDGLPFFLRPEMDPEPDFEEMIAQ